MEHRKIRINSDIIKKKGRQFAQALFITNPSAFSNEWLQSFKERHSFRQHYIHDESGDTEIFNIDIILTTIKEKIAQYQAQDVYNMDETGLFYNLASDTIISRRQIEGAKKDKTCLTIAFTCNANGSDRLSSLFIDHVVRPCYFNKKTGEEHGFYYLHNKKA